MDEVLRMGTLVENAVSESIQVLETYDPTRARRVIEGDALIDRLEIQIEERCLGILALEQPVASDLRTVSTALKIITDLERIGDYAANIARVSLKLEGQPLVKPLVDIPRMAELDRQMLRAAVQAFIRRDVAAAYALVEDDDQVDGLYNQVFRELLQIMIKDPDTINQGAQLILVARYLERMGDHVTNFAEWIIFMLTGERPHLN
jgi:phosphate transport system protein